MSQLSQYTPDTRTRNGDSLEKPSGKSIQSTLAGAILLAGVASALIFFVSVSADLILLHGHEPARLTIEISDAVSAIVIGLLSYRIIRLQQQRREYVRQKVVVIADMNHHVRNALQVISLTTHGGDQQEIVAIRESVNRIQWALRELLPKI
jgi:hypothetical protein